MMSAITIFEKNSFIFSFVDYELVTKSLGSKCTFEEVGEKTKYEKMNVNFSQPNEIESSHLVSRGQNPLKLLYSIMILNTISFHASQGRANKISLLCRPHQRGDGGVERRPKNRVKTE
jgi:hypothetical protein